MSEGVYRSEPGWLHAAVRDRLVPTEVTRSLLAIFDEGRHSNGCAAVTNMNLRLLRFQRSGLSRSWRVADSEAVPLTSVTGVAFDRHQRVSFRCDGVPERRFKVMSPEQVGAFAAALEHAMATARAPRASVGDELARLRILVEEGVLNEGDFERAKDLFLGKQVDKRQIAVEQLRQLHGLARAGVLTESEFRMKKWDVLAKD